VFLGGDRDCRTSYSDRGGKYNNQGAAIILPRV
jgi:deoxycytidine triphosphate deaminase